MLILGVTTLICVLALGLLLMFNFLNLDLSPAERYGFGGLMIIYGILRFTRIFRKEPNGDE